MKVPSLNNNGKEYTVCQIKRASPEHMQATEAISGWEMRPYGSAFNAEEE